MRKLVTTDVFRACRIVTKSGLKEKLLPLIKRIGENEMTVEDVGINGILTVLEVVTDEGCERLIYDWLAGPFEMTAQEVANLELDAFIASLTQLSEENDLKNFFTALFKLISKKP